MRIEGDFYTALDQLHRLGLRDRPGTDVQIEVSSGLVGSFAGMSARERQEASAAVARSSAWSRVLTLSGCLAETVVNTGDATLIATATGLHAIEDFRHDYRENVRYLVLIAHAARKIGASFDDALHQVTLFASEGAKRRLQEFGGRTADLNRLSSFGVREQGTTGCFRFVPA